MYEGYGTQVSPYFCTRRYTRSDRLWSIPVKMRSVRILPITHRTFP